MRIQCRAAMEGRGSKHDRPMASHRTSTVIWIRAHTRMSLVSRIRNTSTPFKGIESARFWGSGFWWAVR